MSVLRARGLTYRYAGSDVPALQDVTLDIHPGQFVVLAGDSASGKSTLLRAAGGLVPHFHGGDFAGQVHVGGLDTRDHGPAELAAVAGSLFQDPETQSVLGTVRAELAFGLENRGYAAAAVARGVEEAALALGIEGLLDRTTHELSGGELQRVALGAALAGRPQILLLDEPTSQLDPVAGDELVWLLRRLNEEQGTAVLVAEHRLERCLAHADRVIALVDGRVGCDAPPPEFLAWAAEERPQLLTPGARLFHRAGITPYPPGVKAARAGLCAHALLPPADDVAAGPPSREDPAEGRLRRVLGRASRSSGRGEPALRVRDLWHELDGGRAILRAVDLELMPGECVAMMGRNGAGKSTLLRHIAGLQAPTRGSVRAAGRVGLLVQHPGDYVLHERVGDEAPAAALAAVGLDDVVDRHPRDLSGGQRQRLALAVVLGDGPPPPVLLLDEPTRGMDRLHKATLLDRLAGIAAGGTAVVVATHDAEFAAAFADRVLLIADGRPIADAPVREVLTGGWYFATETARILGGEGGALLPDEGAALLAARRTVHPPHDVPQVSP